MQILTQAALLAINTPQLVSAAEQAGTLGRIAGNAALQVRLRVTAGIVAVRPWVWIGGAWWPHRFDAAAGAGVLPVTADIALAGGRASGIFATPGISAPFALVAESGLPANVAAAEVDKISPREM